MFAWGRDGEYNKRMTSSPRGNILGVSLKSQVNKKQDS
jgi:hypothetical protein